MLEIVPLDYVHLPRIAKFLRDGDQAELKSVYANAIEGLTRSLELSVAAMCCIEDGVPIAAWGLTCENLAAPGAAEMWCMTTHDVERHKKDILRFGRHFVRAVEQFYPVQTCWVMATYKASINWLKWLGFSPVHLQVFNGVAFIKMQRKTSECATLQNI